MNTSYDFERITLDWLADGPTEVPATTLDAALAEVHRTRQARLVFGRAPSVALAGHPLRFAFAAAVVVAAVVAAFVLAGSLIRPPDQPANPLPIEPPPATSSPLEPAPTVSGVAYPGAGTIAFTRFDPSLGDTATWLISPDGKSETQPSNLQGIRSMGTTPGTGCCGVFSPDGLQIAIGYDVVDPSWGGATTQEGTWVLPAVVDLQGDPVFLLPVFCGGCANEETATLCRARGRRTAAWWRSRSGTTACPASMASTLRRRADRTARADGPAAGLTSATG